MLEEAEQQLNEITANDIYFQEIDNYLSND